MRLRGDKLRLLALLGLALCLSLPAQAEPAAHRLPVVFHVAESEGRPAVDADFLGSQLAHANTIFRALGIELVCLGLRPAPRMRAKLVSRPDRDRLGALLQAGVINVFVAATLMDVDEPGRVRRGVHWRVRSDPSLHLVIVSAIAGPYVLAHELGHYFGNAAHSDTPGNLMSYQQTGEVPVLEAPQRQRVQATLARMLETGELRDGAKARCLGAVPSSPARRTRDGP